MWLVFALVAPFAWAISNVGDSYARRVFLKNDMALTVLSSVVFLVLAIPLGVILIPQVPMGSAFFVMLMGSLWSLAFLPYIRAIASEEASRVVLLMQATPVWALILAAIFIDEHLTMMQLAAFGVFLIAGVLAGTKKNAGKFHFNWRPVLLVSLASLPKVS